MKLKTRVANKLSTKLIGFLPILKTSLDELPEKLKEASYENPLIEIKNRRVVTFGNLKNAITDEIEALSVSKKGFYEELLEQIENSQYFPTEKSRFIAFLIAEDITPEGYFEGDIKEIARLAGIDENSVEKIRQRFKYLSPPGVGAKDLKESMLFQLEVADLEIDDSLYSFVRELIENLEKIYIYSSHPDYDKAIGIIKQFNATPSIEYDISEDIVPEIIVINDNGNLEIRLNEEYYPEIYIKECGDDKYSRGKFKEARSLIDALEMRKSTLKKIALMIVEIQYEFFQGGIIRPMKIQDIAEELDFAPSTISRAVANKYLLCDRGIIPLKNFFSTALDEDVSANQIKEEIKNIINNEDKNRPLSDDKIAKTVNEKYSLKLVRRTITKYREVLQIPSSRERKKIYRAGGNLSF